LANAPYIDFHNHSKYHNDEVVEVVSIHGTQEKKLTYYTIGYHPWWTDKKLDEQQTNLIKQKYENDKFCLGIGEFGLDKLKGINLKLQEDIAIQQIILANELKAPVIIHCVRAYDRLIRLKRTYGQTTWAVHGYMRNKILAGQLMDEGIQLSVAPYEKMNISFMEMLQFVPLDQIFLETDSDFTINIMGRYRIFADLRKMALEPLKAQLYQNFITFYKEKWKYHSGWNEQHY